MTAIMAGLLGARDVFSETWDSVVTKRKYREHEGDDGLKPGASSTLGGLLSARSETTWVH